MIKTCITFKRYLSSYTELFQVKSIVKLYMIKFSLRALLAFCQKFKQNCFICSKMWWRWEAETWGTCHTMRYLYYGHQQNRQRHAPSPSKNKIWQIHHWCVTAYHKHSASGVCSKTNSAYYKNTVKDNLGQYSFQGPHRNVTPVPSWPWFLMAEIQDKQGILAEKPDTVLKITQYPWEMKQFRTEGREL